MVDLFPVFVSMLMYNGPQTHSHVTSQLLPVSDWRQQVLLLPSQDPPPVAGLTEGPLPPAGLMENEVGDSSATKKGVFLSFQQSAAKHWVQFISSKHLYFCLRGLYFRLVVWSDQV